MKRKINRITITMLITLTLIITSACGSESFVENVEITRENTASYLMKKVKDAGTDTTGGDWTVIGLAKSGVDTDEEYFRLFNDNVRAKVKASRGILHPTKMTEFQRTAIALKAIGEDPLNVEGYNLMEKVDNFEKLKAQGINAETFALISSNVTGYELKCEDQLIDDILASQKDDGGFSLSDGEAAIDITAMVIQGLSFYKDQKVVDNAIDASLKYLISHLGDMVESSAESISQVMIALNMVDIDYTQDERFILGDQNLGDMLFDYIVGDAFSHVKGEDANVMATEHGLLAMASHKLFLEGEKLYKAEI